MIVKNIQKHTARIRMTAIIHRLLLVEIGKLIVPSLMHARRVNYAIIFLNTRYPFFISNFYKQRQGEIC